MSFSINGPEPTPAIQPSHQTNDGGAGNLGYFQQEKKKKKEDKDDNDILELSNKKDEEETIEAKKEPDYIGSKIKTFWFKIHGIFSEVIDDGSNPEDDDNNPFNY